MKKQFYCGLVSFPRGETLFILEFKCWLSSKEADLPASFHALHVGVELM